MAWGGLMTAEILNYTNQEIAIVVVHENSLWKDGYPLAIMRSLARNKFDFHVNKGKQDYWSLSMLDYDGVCYYRPEMACDIKEEDFNSGGHVEIIITLKYFDIIKPKSKSCKMNTWLTP
jgi:hypothetical protein